MFTLRGFLIITDLEKCCIRSLARQWRKQYYGKRTDILARSNGSELKRLNDGFISYKHAAFHFTRHWLMDWRRVDYLWITVMFLSAVWTLIPTAPIHCRGKISPNWLLHGLMEFFLEMYHFWMNYYFKLILKKVTIKTFMMLQKISIQNKCCSFLKIQLCHHKNKLTRT